MLKKIGLIGMFLAVLGFAPQQEPVSRCAEFVAFYNADGQARQAAYDYFMAMDGTPAYSLDKLPELDPGKFWVFDGLLHDSDPAAKIPLFGLVAAAAEQDEPTFLMIGMINPDDPIVYLLIFDFTDGVSLCDAFIIGDQDALVLAALAR